MLLPASGFGVSLLFCAYFAISSFLGIAITTALEERGRALDATDNVAALQVFFWTAGFAGGGLLAVIANSGAASAARQKLVMAAVGAINLGYTTYFVSTRVKTR